MIVDFYRFFVFNYNFVSSFKFKIVYSFLMVLKDRFSKFFLKIAFLTFGKIGNF